MGVIGRVMGVESESVREGWSDRESDGDRE